MTADLHQLAFAKLKDDKRRKLRVKEEIFRSIAAEVRRTGNPRIVKALCEEHAARIARRGFSWLRLYNQFYEWERKGRKTHALVVSTGKTIGLPEAFLEFWRALIEQSQRKIRPAYRRLVRDLWPSGAAIPGYGTWRDWYRREWPDREIPRVCPPDLPYGWTYENLRKHKPTRIEVAAARIGLVAARDYAPGVYLTRAGCWVGSHYFFDDLWHDHFVASPRLGGTGRPMEFHALDYFSGRKIAWGFTLRIKEDGKYRQLKEHQMRFLLAKVLHVDGYSARGTILGAEHGTAAIRAEIEEELAHCTGGLISVDRSGIIGEEQAHAAQYAGLGKGNFKFKACLESLGNLIHNECDALPGQTGRDVAHRPEQLHGLLDETNALLRAMRDLPPEKAAAIQLGLLTDEEWHWTADRIYGQINGRTEHALEGWQACGHTCVEWRIATGTPWLPRTALAALPPPDRDAILEMIARDPSLTRTRLLSPQEVWDKGAGELLKLPGYGVCAILGNDLAVERPVRDGQIAFADAEAGPGLHRFRCVAVAEDGTETRLRDGDTFQTFINPFAPHELFVRERNGAYLGICARIATPSRADAEAVRREMGRAAHDLKTALLPMQARHAEEARARAAAARHNAALLAAPAEEHDRLSRLADDALSDLTH